MSSEDEMPALASGSESGDDSIPKLEYSDPEEERGEFEGCEGWVDVWDRIHQAHRWLQLMWAAVVVLNSNSSTAGTAAWIDTHP